MSQDSARSAQHRWAAGVKLAAELNAEFASGRATRPAFEVERRLASCRQCDQFKGDDCAELELLPDGPSYLHLLTQEDLHCRRWSILFDRRSGCWKIIYQEPRGTIVGAGEETLARMHAQGPIRSQADRRAARREGRRRKAVGGRR